MKSFNVTLMEGRKVVTVLISAETKAEALAQAARRGRVLKVKKIGSLGYGKMSLPDRMVFFQRLASMLASKVGTSEALEIIFQSFTGTVREAARILRDRVIAGSSLSEAMEAAGPRFFPETIVAIIKTGSRGGDISYALQEAARFEKELDDVKRASSKGMGSAVTGFIFGLATILGSTLYVAPMILNSTLVTMAEGIDVGWIMTLANVFTVLALVVAAIVGGLFLFGVVLRPFAPAFVDRGILRIPFYRDMSMARMNYMVFFGLAVLLKAGLRVEEALTLTIESAPKGELKNDLERARTAIVKGTSKPWPYHMTMLHPTDKAALATAQDRTQTSKTIESLALQYQAIYKSRLELFVPLLQFFSAILLSVAGFVLFGVSIIPLMQSMSSILKGV